MKKFVPVCLLCILFVFSINVGYVFALHEEELNFYHNNKIFSYQLGKNIKQSAQFDLNYEINKLNRFSSVNERKSLLLHLINIGFDYEIALNYIFPNLKNTIEKIEKNIYIESKNASCIIDSNTEKVFKITKETIGKSLNKQQLYFDIYSAYINDKPLKFNLPITLTYPNITTEFYKKQTALRSDFSTNISTSSADRKHNIKNALASINKTEIMPNEVFSFNKVVGRRTETNGYRNAKIIVNNEFVDGVGGGVCQVSSTLYNTALLSGLEIIEANKHSKQVGYVKYGFDAMVNFGSSDLKFKNNTNQKLTIITNYSPNKIRIRIFGESLNNITYKLTNEILDVVEPTEEIKIDTENQHTDKVIYEDEYFYLKTASKGITIKSYREKFINNNCVEKVLLRTDKYKVQNAIKVYGSKPKPETNPFDSQETHAQNMHLI